MGGFFAVASKEECIFDLFFGTDYHSHLGTRRGGLATYGKRNGFNRSIHKIENSPFRTKFSSEINEMSGNLGIGCISDYDPQPLLIRSHLGTYAIVTVGKINNQNSILEEIFRKNRLHFFEMTSGEINQTELVASIINQRDNLVDGIRYAQELIDGSMSMLLLTEKGIYAARDLYGRTPIAFGKKEGAYSASFESYAYLNLGYTDYWEMAPGEISVINPDSVTILHSGTGKLKICTFLWIYYGYPSSKYEGNAVETVRCRNGSLMARSDVLSKEDADIVAGVPDSGTAHAIGYSMASGIPFARPLIKYTPTWPRSFMPSTQQKRELIAKMKILPVKDFIFNQRIVLIDDSIVRGTQLRDTAEYLFSAGAREVHARPACPPILFACKYLNFSRSTYDMDLIARRIIHEIEGGNGANQEEGKETLLEYTDSNSDRYIKMVDGISQKMNFTSLRYCRLCDMLSAVGVSKEKLCTYCWNGKT